MKGEYQRRVREQINQHSIPQWGGDACEDSSAARIAPQPSAKETNHNSDEDTVRAGREAFSPAESAADEAGGECQEAVCQETVCQVAVWLRSSF